MEKKKNGFASGIGFILAAAGSAIGLGNLWAFPYKTSKNGGAAFVLVCVACVIVIGIVTMLAEMYIGRRAAANTVTSYKKVNTGLGFFGLLALGIPFLITCYYSVLGGWTLRYAFNSFQAVEAANNANSFAAFVGNAYEPVFYTVIFLFLAGIIIMAGVKGGIEKASKVLMPILFVILLFIVVFCLCLGDGVADGLNYYLNPDFGALGFSGVVAAMGQAFFSLSLGMGIMICYGSYTGKEVNIGKSCVMVCIFDTLVALLAGFAIFPAIGALMPEELGEAGGVGLVYKILPAIFEKMGALGPVISFLFFVMVSIAALTSVISLMEVVAQFVIQAFHMERKKATLLVGAICFVISIFVAWSVGGAPVLGGITVFGFDLLTFFDEASNIVLMPLCALGACIAVGWIIGEKKSLSDWVNPMVTARMLEKDGLSIGKFQNIFAVMVKYVTPVLILVVEIFGIIGQIKAYGSDYFYILAFAGILLLLCVAVYFIFLRKRNLGKNADEAEVTLAEAKD